MKSSLSSFLDTSKIYHYNLIVSGGIFLATGSADQVIRVYSFTSNFPEKICELEAHTVCIKLILSLLMSKKE